MRRRISLPSAALALTLFAACDSSTTPITDAETIGAPAAAQLVGNTLAETRILELQQAGALNAGQANALLVKVRHAASLLAAGRPSQAALVMEAYFHQVRAWAAVGLLSTAQGDSLIAAGQVLLVPLEDLLPGVWAFQDVGFCFFFQTTFGTMDLFWIDRDAGIFGGDMTFLNTAGGVPGIMTTQAISNGHMAPDGTIQFSAPFQFQFSNPPQQGVFDGTTITTTWTANCSATSDFGGPVTHTVVYTRP